MTCPGCGCTVGWDCECSTSTLAAEAEQDRQALQTTAAYAVAVLSQLSQHPEPLEGAARYAEESLSVLESMLAAAGLLDQVRARIEELPRRLLPSPRARR